jgi:hypothetical protein
MRYDCQNDGKPLKTQYQMLIDPLGIVQLIVVTTCIGQVPVRCSPHQTDTRAADKIKEAEHLDV